MKYQKIKEGEPYNPVLECGRCMKARFHKFVEERGKFMLDYTMGYVNAPLRLDANKETVPVIGFLYACQTCGEHRFWGNKG